MTATEHFWSLLNHEHQQLLLDRGHRHDHPAGTVLIRMGDTAESVLVLLTGRVKVTTTGVSGHQGLLGIRVAGDIVGEMAAIDDHPRSATVIAVDRLSVLRIPIRDFVEIIRTRAAVCHALLRVMTTRLRASDQKRLESGEATTAQRVAAALAELSADHGVMEAGQLTIALPFSQDELAMMVGASREAVVRALRDLRSQGIIRTSRQRITVLEPDTLGQRVFGAL